MKLVGRHGSSPPGLLVLPARLCGAAAGNRSHRYIGKVCCLLLVRAEYMGRAPGRGPEGTGNCTLRVTARFKLFVSGRAKAGWPGQLGCSRRSHGPMRCWVWPQGLLRFFCSRAFPEIFCHLLVQMVDCSEPISPARVRSASTLFPGRSQEIFPSKFVDKLEVLYTSREQGIGQVPKVRMCPSFKFCITLNKPSSSNSI